VSCVTALGHHVDNDPAGGLVSITPAIDQAPLHPAIFG
jgi:hypothetical protein